MSYLVCVTGPAIRTLNQLREKVAGAVVEFITGALADNPHRLSKPLHKELADRRVARRGAYRVILSIDDATETVYIQDIAHRAHAYQRRRIH